MVCVVCMCGVFVCEVKVGIFNVELKIRHSTAATGL